MYGTLALIVALSAVQAEHKAIRGRQPSLPPAISEAESAPMPPASVHGGTQYSSPSYIYGSAGGYQGPSSYGPMPSYSTGVGGYEALEPTSLQGDCGCASSCGGGCHTCGDCIGGCGCHHPYSPWVRRLIWWALSTCDMYGPDHYYPISHGYYYFRPYNYRHVAHHQSLVAQWGGDPRNPYDNRMFQQIYAECEAYPQPGSWRTPVETVPAPHNGSAPMPPVVPADPAAPAPPAANPAAPAPIPAAPSLQNTTATGNSESATFETSRPRLRRLTSGDNTVRTSLNLVR